MSSQAELISTVIKPAKPKKYGIGLLRHRLFRFSRSRLPSQNSSISVYMRMLEVQFTVYAQ